MRLSARLRVVAIGRLACEAGVGRFPPHKDAPCEVLTMRQGSRAARRPHPRALAETCAGEVLEGPFNAYYCLDCKLVRKYLGVYRISVGHYDLPSRFSTVASPNLSIAWLTSLDMDSTLAEKPGMIVSMSSANTKMPYVEQSP